MLLVVQLAAQRRDQAALEVSTVRGSRGRDSKIRQMDCPVQLFGPKRQIPWYPWSLRNPCQDPELIPRCYEPVSRVFLDYALLDGTGVESVVGNELHMLNILLLYISDVRGNCGVSHGDPLMSIFRIDGLKGDECENKKLSHCEFCLQHYVAHLVSNSAIKILV